MSFLKPFQKFGQVLTIDSKEEGQRPLYPLLGTQRYALEEIAKGMEEGIHTFVILKGRQAGVSTLCNAIDAYWIHRHQGMQGTLVTDDESNRETFRATITQFIEGLPHQYRIPVIAHNRTHLILGNRSRLIYQVAGKKMTASSASLGQGKGIAFMHGTEVASWPDPDGVASLFASFAEKNPNRLYIFESTAKGHNIFEEIWETSKKSVSQRGIFVGWWRHDKYVFTPDTQEFKVYWGEQPKLTAEERNRVYTVKKKYGYDITEEQIAWYRYQHYEKFHQDEVMLTQEHPWDEEEAFVMTGAQWFASKVITDHWNHARKQKFQGYKFSYGEQFYHTRLFESVPRHAELKVWEQPVPGGVYVVAGDPAYGSSDNADRFVLQVLRCYADQCVQVAEFATTDCSTYQFAWVALSLAGAYRNAYFILEINGPGGAVFEEMKNVRRMAGAAAMFREDGSTRDALKNAVSNIRNYIWSKPDQMGNGTNTLHWKTNHDNKQLMLNMLRDHATRFVMEINSEEAIKEMRKIVREPNGDIKGDGTAKDDRVIALALGSVMWHTRVRPQLMRQGATRQWVEEQQNKQEPVQNVAQLAVIQTLDAMKIRRRGAPVK